MDTALNGGPRTVLAPGQPSTHTATAFIEITPGSDGSLPRRLIEFAYRASGSAVIVLALTRTEAHTVDRLLDGVVRECGHKMKGVIYVDSADRTAVLRWSRRARLVLAASGAMQALLDGAGVAWEVPEEGSRMLVPSGPAQADDTRVRAAP